MLRRSFYKKAKIVLLWAVLLMLPDFNADAQTRYIDSLKNKLKDAADTPAAAILNQLAEAFIDSASSAATAQKHLLLRDATSYAARADSSSRKINYQRGIGLALMLAGDIKVTCAMKNIPAALEDYKKALLYLKASGDLENISKCYYLVAGDCHFMGRLDESITYYDSAITCYLQRKDTLKTTESMIWQAHSYFDKGDYKNAYLFGSKALKWAEKTGDKDLMVFANLQLASMFLRAGLPETTIEYLHKIVALHPLTPPQGGQTTLPYNMVWALWVGGEAYLKLNRVDSVLYLSKFIPEDTTDGDSERFYGQLYTALHQEEKALPIFVKGFELKRELGHEIGTAGTAVELGQIYLKRKDYKNAIYYTNYGLTTAEKIHALLEKKDAVGILTEIYSQTGNYRLAYRYSNEYKLLNDSLASEQDRRRLSLALIQSQLDDQKQQGMLLNKESQIKDAQLKTDNLLKKIFIAGILAVLLIAVIIYRSYHQKQKANTLLEKQKAAIQNTLQELKATQAQLIQSEKMASLGQLTAGIAHEIQNPLNFVNNFSEVNSELIADMKQELDKNNLTAAKEIADEIDENEKKISHHGKRADAIVKGMLQHSQKSSGKKELTDINLLADEYLKLAYHGLKAKDQFFSVKMETQFDAGIGKINIVPQEIGKVLLNLINNAFYAITEKARQDVRPLPGAADTNGQEYVPTVWLQTKKINTLPGTTAVEIRVKDNGNGIRADILDKIFQPFFTTKPTGLGTGLGLSLSYDIITAQGGNLRVETKEGEFAAFIIELGNLRDP